MYTDYITTPFTFLNSNYTMYNSVHRLHDYTVYSHLHWLHSVPPVQGLHLVHPWTSTTCTAPTTACTRTVQPTTPSTAILHYYSPVHNCTVNYTLCLALYTDYSLVHPVQPCTPATTPLHCLEPWTQAIVLYKVYIYVHWLHYYTVYIPELQLYRVHPYNTTTACIALYTFYIMYRPVHGLHTVQPCTKTTQLRLYSHIHPTQCSHLITALYIKYITGYITTALYTNCTMLYVKSPVNRNPVNTTPCTALFIIHYTV